MTISLIDANRLIDLFPLWTLNDPLGRPRTEYDEPSPRPVTFTVMYLAEL